MSASWKDVLVTVLLCAGVVITGQAFAEEDPPPSRVKVDVSVGTWITTGDTRWSHNASSDPRYSNPTSKLTYADHTTNVAELTAKVSVGPRWFGRLNFGFANIGGGRITDDDYARVDGGNVSARTHSDINGSGMWYVNADAGAHLMNFNNGSGTLDGFVGFQYWREEHKAYGLRQVLCTSGGTTITGCPSSTLNNSTLVVTNTTTWYSIRTGLQTDYRLTKWLSFQGSLVLKPLSFFENQDTHHRRPDLSQDPSIGMVGIGVGADADAGLKFNITKALALNVGYRVFWNRMLDGTWKIHYTNGSSLTYPMTEFQSIRHGVTAGINYIF